MKDPTASAPAPTPWTALRHRINPRDGPTRDSRVSGGREGLGGRPGPVIAPAEKFPPVFPLGAVVAQKKRNHDSPGYKSRGQHQPPANSKLGCCTRQPTLYHFPRRGNNLRGRSAAGGLTGWRATGHCFEVEMPGGSQPKGPAVRAVGGNPVGRAAIRKNELL